MLRTLMVAALAGYVSAHLSCECQYALAAITANPEAAACLSPDIFIPALTPGLAGVKNAKDTSVTSKMDTWLTNMCAATPCSQETFSAVVSNITDGCSGDHGIPETLLDILQDVRPVYTTVRKMLCLKDTDTCTYCTTKTLRAVLGDSDSMDLSSCAISHWLSNIGTIVKTLKAYTQIRRGVIRPGSRGTSQKRQLIVQADVARLTHHSTRFGPYGLQMDSNASCTTCVKEAAAIINEDFPNAVDCLFPGMKGVCEANSNSSDVLRLCLPHLLRLSLILRPLLRSQVLHNSSAGERTQFPNPPPYS